MKIISGIASVSTFLLLIGCDDNVDFMPPLNSPIVKFDVDIPDDIELGAAKIMYRSSECQAKKPRSDGGSYFVPGYHFLEKSFPKKSEDGIYHLSIPKGGGGQCEWLLSNITVSIRYKLDSFEPRADYSVGAGFIIVFDDNAPQRYGGILINKQGDFTINMDLYPWINESFIPKHENTLWLYGDDLYYNYRAINTKEILIKPFIHSNLLTRSQGPKIKGEGSFSVIKYPDGSIDFKGDSSPDFKRLQSIKDKTAR